MQGNKSNFRVALLGIYHESNTFLPKRTTLADFTNGHLFKGMQIRDEYAAAYHEIGGMMEVLDQHAVEVVPILFAEATPGGIIAAEAFNALLKDMLEGLEKAGPVDACLVVPHGAAVSEEFKDMDGHWLSLIRKHLGQIPIVGTIDPHANVSHQMIEATDVLIAYATNPHVDQRETGKKAATLLVKMLNGAVKPTQKLIQVPLAISIEQQNTSAEPCKSLYNYAATIMQVNKLLSISIVLGFPYADVAEMGTSIIIISDELRKESAYESEGILNYIQENRGRFVGEKQSVNSQLEKIAGSPRPVLLLDMGDNVGGGADGDSTNLLVALDKKREYKTFICIYDPVAVKKSLKHTLNSRFNLSFGRSYTPTNPEPYFSEVTLLQVTDGKFKELQPRHGGQVNYDMGPTVIISTPCGNVVMLTSNRIAPFSLAQLTSFGIVPNDFDVIIAKGVNAPIAAYAPVCPSIIQMDTAGLTQADMTLFTYYNRRKPLFPFEH